MIGVYAPLSGAATGMTGSEDHRGSLRLVDLSEVSHARGATIADLIVVERTGHGIHAAVGGRAARPLSRVCPVLAPVVAYGTG